MRKRITILIIALFAFIMFQANAFAKEMKLEELSKEIEKVNPGAQSAYIIGNYVFTSGHLLTTQDVMLAARSIEVEDKTGATDSDNIYGEMTIHEAVKVYDQKNHESLGWFPTSNTDGKTEFNANTILNIKYIDYQHIQEETKFTISTDIKDKKYQDAINKYKFEENFSGGEKLYSKELNLDEKGNLTGLIKPNSKVDDSVFDEKTRTGYYVPIVITIPNANKNTTFKIKSWWGEKDVDYDSFDIQEEKESGIAILMTFDKDSKNKKTIITIDLDGEDTIYAATSYTINWEDLRFEASLYNTIKSTAKSDEEVDFSKVASESNGQGVLTINSTMHEENPIYYYRGEVDNNVIFNNICWQIVRTTDTGSIKLIYNGEPKDGKCNNKGTDSVITKATDNKFSYADKSNWPTYAGYTVPEITTPQIDNKSGIVLPTSSVFDSVMFASSFEYKDGKYHLKDPITIDKYLFGAKDNNYVGMTYTKVIEKDNDYDKETIKIEPGNIEEARRLLKDHPYTCLPSSNSYFIKSITECETISYVIYAEEKFNGGKQNTGTIGYFNFTNGEGFDSSIIDNFTSHKNTTKSRVKVNNDNFYSNSIDGYPKALALIDEDAKYCNRRTVEDYNIFSTDERPLTSNTKNGLAVNYSLLYKSYSDLLDGNDPTLDCDENDIYSKSLGDEFLYPVGLLSADEANYAGIVFNKNDAKTSSSYLSTGAKYWLMTPAYVTDVNTIANPLNMMIVNEAGKFTSTVATMTVGVYLKPVITIKGTAAYSKGNGSATDPYLIIE